MGGWERKAGARLLGQLAAACRQVRGGSREVGEEGSGL